MRSITAPNIGSCGPATGKQDKCDSWFRRAKTVSVLGTLTPTDNESRNLQQMFMHSSVMDYAGEITRLYGLGSL